MRTLTKLILTCGVLAVGLLQASATLTLRLSADGGQTWVSVVDGGPLDSNPTTGIVQFSGPVGSWFVDINTGFGSPLLGSSINPVMDLGTTSSSSDSANLIVQLSDTGFTPFPNETFILQSGGFAGGSVVYTAYRDSGNVQFGTTATYTGDPAGISPSPTASILSSISAVSGNYQASNTVVVANGTGPFSLTLETVLVHNSATHSSTDSSLTVLPPPPCNCTLTFTSPQFITNCAGDAIPNVTASEDCGSGPVSVPVAFVSASTNGVCPQIITRNFTATDDCSTVHPFSQTITINCKPDCTITPSVTTATVGGTGYTASVANAGVGATYVWSILNGSITAGQNTRTITWSAGTDTNNPIIIFVTITSATGCQSCCSTSANLIPPPPRFGKGDAATIGFWHNKNGQGLINNAPSGPPTLANWLATNFPCLYGSSAPSGNNLTGKSNSDVANLFLAKFGVSGTKTDAQVMSVALASYFTSTSLGGGAGPVKFGFNQSPGGTGAKLFNVGSFGTALGLQNNTSYTILQILQAANNIRCSNQNATLPNDLFNNINTGGDIN